MRKLDQIVEEIKEQRPALYGLIIGIIENKIPKEEEETIISQKGVQLALSNNQYKILDNVLMTYRHLPSRIARRKLEIETEHSADINIGASKTNRVNKRTEWLVERFDSDMVGMPTKSRRKHDRAIR